MRLNWARVEMVSLICDQASGTNPISRVRVVTRRQRILLELLCAGVHAPDDIFFQVPVKADKIVLGVSIQNIGVDHHGIISINTSKSTAFGGEAVAPGTSIGQKY